MSQVKVIDYYSGNDPDFKADKEAGYVGVIFKGGQGVLADVPRVRPDWPARAKDVGLAVGWYWLVDSRYKASRQVDAVYEALHEDFGELGLWADVEKPIISMSDAAYWETMFAGHNNIYNFMSGIESASGDTPGFYSSLGFWNLVFKKLPADVQKWYAQAPLWTAQYTTANAPTMYGAWDTWTFWQYMEGPDVNLYNGSLEEFKDQFGIDPTIVDAGNGYGENISHAPEKKKIEIIYNPDEVEIKLTESK